MSRKLKFVLGGLLLSAAFLVFRAGSYIAKSFDGDGARAPLAAIGAVPVGQPAGILKDTDADGVPDDEETEAGTNPFDADTDDDGYLDGEEIAAAYDPAQKGDDNTRAPKNLTNLFTQRLIAGIAAGDLDPKNGKGEAYEQGLSMISASIIGEADAMFMENTQSPTLHIVPTTEQTLSNYSTALTSILDDKALTDAFGDQPRNVKKAFDLMANGKSEEGIAILQGYETLFATKRDQLAITPVPEGFVVFHKTFMVRFGELANIYAALAQSEHDEMMQTIAGQRLVAAIAGLRSDLFDNLIGLLTKAAK